MNITNLTINNFSEFSIQNMDAGIYYRTICTQLNHYFIRMGIIIIILYIFICWFNWWFFNYGYKKINVKDEFISNCVNKLENRDTRIYWDMFIKEKLLKLAIGYIVVVIYFNWIG